MARQESVTLIDDIDGGRADETVSFGLDGATYEIDVNKKKATALRKVLAEFVSAARLVKPQRSAGPTTTKARRAARPSPGDPLPAQIRVWAGGQGIAVPARGRVPESVRAQYVSAHAS